MLRICFMVFVTCLWSFSSAAEIVADGEEVLVYDDGLLSGISGAGKKMLKDDLKKRKIKISSKSRKEGTLIGLIDTIEKDVIKKKPEMVVLSFGMYDVYDFKAKAVKDYDKDEIQEALIAVIDHLQSAGIRVIVATPGLVDEDMDAEHQSDIDNIAQMIIDTASEKGVAVCNIRNKAVKWLASNPKGKKGKA
ncbi:MAG: hypothetical protein HRU15_16210, partial [Planctomycetes bacterium]|nr:hypothetical protein [Planctomycetota bacterium]